MKTYEAPTKQSSPTNDHPFQSLSSSSPSSDLGDLLTVDGGASEALAAGRKELARRAGLHPRASGGSLVEAALAYVARDWPVIPLHSISPRGGCTCKLGRICRSPGKHPRTKNGLTDGSTDEASIRAWWRRWPNANVGIVTGPSSGLVVIDEDRRKGGTESLRRFEAEQGPTPATLEAITGGGGRHLCFRYPRSGRRIPSATGVLPGVDVRADGGYIVAPPSLHVTGLCYSWYAERGPDTCPLAPLPPALFKLVVATDVVPLLPTDQAEAAAIPAGQRNDALASIAGTMRRRGLTKEEILAALLEVNRRRCKPPVEEGEVDVIARSVARYNPAAALVAEDRVPAEERDFVNANQLSQQLPVDTWPPPLGQAAFYGLAGDLVRAIEPHTESDPVGILLQLLVSIGNVFGRTPGKGPHFRVEADIHHLNLFALLVGRTAKSRKGTSWGRVRRILAAVEPDWTSRRIFSGLSSGEGLIWAVRDPIENRKGEEEDPGVADKRLLVLATEFASVLRMLRREGNILSPTIREAWDSGNLQIMTKNSPARATGAHISILGHITSEELQRYLDATEVGNGFANRFLLACVQRAHVLPEGGGTEDPKQLVPLLERLQTAFLFGKEAREIRRDEDARRLWRDVYEDLSAGQPGIFGAITSRAEAQVVRLACLYAVIDLSRFVRTKHLEAALELWRYCAASCHHVFGDAIGDPVADVILKALRGNPTGMTRTQIRDFFGRHESEGRILRALRMLAEQGLAHFLSQQTGGRPVERWSATSSVASVANVAVQDPSQGDLR